MSRIPEPSVSAEAFLMNEPERLTAHLKSIVWEVVRHGVHRIKTPVLEVTIRTCDAVRPQYDGTYRCETCTDILVVEVPAKLRGKKVFSQFLRLLETETKDSVLRLHSVVNHDLMDYLISRNYVLDGDFFTRRRT